MTPVAGAGGGRGAPWATTHSPAFRWQRGSWVAFAPSEAWSCFIPTHCRRHHLRVPAWGSARWRWDPVPLLTNCCQAPKHPGEQRERAGANHKDCSYGHLPRAGHMTGAATSPLWGSASSSVK